MEFRPCIDIHNGKVKQIVGGSLRDKNNEAVENFVAKNDAAYYARFYKQKNIRNGHVIILNHEGSRYYEASRKQALDALGAYRDGLQAGGGITAQNAAFYLDAGASHVIVTSYVFDGGRVNFENLRRLVSETGKERLVLDLSCRVKDGKYYIVTDRWQKYTDVELNYKNMEELSQFCDEFLIHAADVEGRTGGIDEGLVKLLGSFDKLPVTYAGGVHSFEDLRLIKELGNGRLNVTIGSALDLFGGPMKLEEVLSYL